MLEIEKAKLEDSSVLNEIQIQAWLDGYINPTEGVSEKDIKAKTEEWRKLGDQRIIKKLTELGAHTWVAKEDGKLIGFIGIKESDNEIEIEGLFVSPEQQGKGIGSKLMDRALSSIDTSKPLRAEVLYYNKKAINFYSSFGFLENKDEKGSTITLPSGKVLHNIVMIKS